MAPRRAALRPSARHPNIRSRAWIYRRYDHLVGSRTVRRPGLDAAVLRLRPSHARARGLARGPGRLDTGHAFGRRARSPCSGRPQRRLRRRRAARPDGLPQLRQPREAGDRGELADAIEGIALAAEALGIPVVSGNVSLYNETDGRPIPPTPVVGCVGLVKDVRRIPSRWREGDVVLLATVPRDVDLVAEAALVRFLWKAAPLLSLAHDVGDQGLEAALVESALWSGIGAEVELTEEPGGGAAVLACAPADVERLGSKGLRRLGVVRGDSIAGFTLDELGQAWST